MLTKTIDLWFKWVNFYQVWFNSNVTAAFFSFSHYFQSSYFISKKYALVIIHSVLSYLFQLLALHILVGTTENSQIILHESIALNILHWSRIMIKKSCGWPARSLNCIGSSNEPPVVNSYPAGYSSSFSWRNYANVHWMWWQGA